MLAHEETGNDFTFQRDRAVAEWCRARGVRFEECPRSGVVRRLRDRNGWHLSWERFMRAPMWEAPMASGASSPDDRQLTMEF